MPTALAFICILRVHLFLSVVAYAAADLLGSHACHLSVAQVNRIR